MSLFNKTSILIAAVTTLSLFCAKPERTYRHLGSQWKINEDGTSVTQANLTIKAPITKVWGFLSDPTKWPEWHSGVSRIEGYPGLKTGDDFIMNYDGKFYGHVVNSEPPHRVIWYGQGLSFFSMTLWELKEEDNGKATNVSIRESRDGMMVWLKLSETEHNKILTTWLLNLQSAAEEM